MINMVAKSGGRRSRTDRRVFLTDRRAFLTVVRIPNRRSGRDRRSWSGRRGGVERRSIKRLKGIHRDSF